MNDLLKSIPWQTYGRREMPAEILPKIKSQQAQVKNFPEHPVFSIIAGANALDDSPLLQSLRFQSYPHWEIIRSLGGNEAQVFHNGIAKAKGAWVGYLDAKDVLAPSALYSFALEVIRDSSDVLYSHEVHLTDNYHEIVRSFSKSQFSWFNLLHMNPIGRAWFVRKGLLPCLEVEEKGFERDLFLRTLEKTKRWALLSQFLCYRVGQSQNCPLSDNHQSLASVQSHLSRLGFAASVSCADDRMQVTPALPNPLDNCISILICFRNRSDWTSRCLESVMRSESSIPIEVVLVNNGSDPLEAERVGEVARRFGKRLRWIDDPHPFNFGQLLNDAISKVASGNLLFFLNNDVFLDRGFSFDALASWALEKSVGVVGMRLRYPDGRIQHGGFRAHYGGFARMARVGHYQEQDPFSNIRREVIGNTFAACMVRREVFDRIGGLRAHEYPNGFGDVAFNFEACRLSLKNLYMGDQGGVHLESASRGLSYEYWEEVGIESEYPDILQRLLRADMGYNLLPQPDHSFRQLKEVLLGALYRRYPRLLRLRPKIKNWVLASENLGRRLRAHAPLD